MAGHVRPHLEHVGLGVALVAAVRAAALRRGQDRPGATVAQLLGLVAAQELVVVGRQAVHAHHEPEALRGQRLGGHVQGVRLELPQVAPGALARHAGQALDAVVDALAEVLAAGEDAIDVPGLGHCRIVVGSRGELGEVHLGAERTHVAGGEHVALAALTPPRAVLLHQRAALGDRVRNPRRVDLRHRLVGPEGHVEQRRASRGRPARLGRRGGWARREVAAGGGVPQPHSRRHSHHRASRVPGGVRHAHVDLAAGRVDRGRGRGCELRAGGGVGEHRGGAVHGEEELRRRRDARAIRPRLRHRRVAERDRERDAVGRLQRVERHAERGLARQRLDAKLHEIGRVVREDRIGRIGQRSVLGREELLDLAERVVGVVGPRRTVVVIEVVLVEELALAVRLRARHEDRRRLPRRSVLQLRRARAPSRTGSPDPDARPSSPRGARTHRPAPSRTHGDHHQRRDQPPLRSRHNSPLPVVPRRGRRAVDRTIPAMARSPRRFPAGSPDRRNAVLASG